MLDLNDIDLCTLWEDEENYLRDNLSPVKRLEWEAGPQGGCGTGWNESFMKYCKECK